MLYPPPWILWLAFVTGLPASTAADAGSTRYPRTFGLTRRRNRIIQVNVPPVPA